MSMYRGTRFILLLLSSFVLCVGNVGYAIKKPSVVLLATGGTIAGEGKAGVDAHYEVARLPVDQLLKAVPEVQNIAHVTGEQIFQISSQDMTNELWLKLARRVNEILRKEDISGVVITHGTDVMEETAYLLNLIVRSEKPVVLTGAMRAPTSLGADGALNLYNAVALAASSKAKGKGVVLFFNDEIHFAREATKSNTTNTGTFQSPEFGILGYVYYGQVRFYRESTCRHTYKSEFDLERMKSLPQVAILYGHPEIDPLLVEQLVKSGVKGIVYAGTGNGNPSKAMESALAKAATEKVVVVRSSRTGSGRVTLNAEVDDKRLGFVVADSLNPQKSRILLMVALTQTSEVPDIQRIFFEY